MRLTAASAASCIAPPAWPAAHLLLAPPASHTKVLQGSPLGCSGDPTWVVSVHVGSHRVAMCVGSVTSPSTPNLDPVGLGTTPAVLSLAVSRTPPCLVTKHATPRGEEPSPPGC